MRNGTNLESFEWSIHDHRWFFPRQIWTCNGTQSGTHRVLSMPRVHLDLVVYSSSHIYTSVMHLPFAASFDSQAHPLAASQISLSSSSSSSSSSSCHGESEEAVHQQLHLNGRSRSREADTRLRRWNLWSLPLWPCSIPRTGQETVISLILPSFISLWFYTQVLFDFNDLCMNVSGLGWVGFYHILFAFSVCLWISFYHFGFMGVLIITCSSIWWWKMGIWAFVHFFDLFIFLGFFHLLLFGVISL